MTVPAEDSIAPPQPAITNFPEDLEMHEFERVDHALNMPLKFDIDLIHEGSLVSTFKIKLPLGSTIGDLS